MKLNPYIVLLVNESGGRVVCILTFSASHGQSKTSAITYAQADATNQPVALYFLALSSPRALA